MKKFVAFLFAASLMLPCAASAAESGVYVAPKIGVGIQHLKVGIDPHYFVEHVSGNKAVFGGGLAVGYDFQTKFAVPVRTELEYLYWGQTSKSKSWEDPVGSIHGKGKVGIQSLFVNAYWDFHNSTAFTPYIGAGLGMGFVKTQGNIDATLRVGEVWAEDSKTETNFAWNIGLGCSYAFNDMISADLAYRYASFGSGKTNGWGGSYHVKSSRNDMHQFMLGLRFTF